MKVLVIDTVAPEGIAYLESRGFRVDQVSSAMPHAEWWGRLGEYDAIVTRSSTAVTAEFLAHARRLRVLGRAGVGVDNIDVEACSRQGVLVVNAPHGNVVSAAEHTVGMLLALVRRIPLAHDALKRFAWDRSIAGTELFRKTAAVIGLGKVGSRVAARLKAFEMDVLVYDPYIPERRARDLGVRLTDLGTALAHADVVTLHVPLTDETENMIAARELALMKRGALLVNCARGGIVSEADLLAALDSGHVGGAAIDVWSEEPPVSAVVKRLIAHPRAVVTPHLGANTHEAQVNVAVDVARQLAAFRDGELVEHAVNVPVGDREAAAEIRPFLALAELLGRFCVQLEADNVERVDVVVAGQVGRRDPELIGRAVLCGLLGPVTAQAVNLVNAHLIARERGLAVAVRGDDAASGYTSLVTVTTQAGTARKIIAGTVFDGAPRIVRLRDLHIEFIPEGHILVLSYGDRPGMVGRIGSILGDHDINIASMHVGRRTPRGRAIVVLLLDEDVPPEVLDEVTKAVQADFARIVRLGPESRVRWAAGPSGYLAEAGGPA
jgi:D-3-phosphoglycerate dehydrogenase